MSQPVHDEEKKVARAKNLLKRSMRRWKRKRSQQQKQREKKTQQQ